jgi:tetratricopeptide (TPR) repeat protein
LWQRSLEIDPTFANAYVALGVIAKDRSDYAQAAEMFQEAMRIVPSDPHTPPMLGESLLELGKVEEAIKILEWHVHSQATTPGAIVDLGQAYLELGRLEEARQTFVAMAETFPDDPRGYYGLARVSAKLGDRDKAQQFMEQYRKTAPLDLNEIRNYSRGYDDLEWLRDLLVKTLHESGQVYRRYGRPAKAEEMWCKSAALDAKHTACRLELLSLYEQQRPADALKVAEELCGIQPENPDYWFNCGLLNSRLEMYDAALSALEQAVKLAPENPKYRRALELGGGKSK